MPCAIRVLASGAPRNVAMLISACIGRALRHMCPGQWCPVQCNHVGQSVCTGSGAQRNVAVLVRLCIQASLWNRKRQILAENDRWPELFVTEET